MSPITYIVNVPERPNSIFSFKSLCFDEKLPYTIFVYQPIPNERTFCVFCSQLPFSPQPARPGLMSPAGSTPNLLHASMPTNPHHWSTTNLPATLDYPNHHPHLGYNTIGHPGHRQHHRHLAGFPGGTSGRIASNGFAAQPHLRHQPHHPQHHLGTIPGGIGSDAHQRGQPPHPGYIMAHTPEQIQSMLDKASSPSARNLGSTTFQYSPSSPRHAASCFNLVSAIVVWQCNRFISISGSKI